MYASVPLTLMSALYGLHNPDPLCLQLHSKTFGVIQFQYLQGTKNRKIVYYCTIVLERKLLSFSNFCYN